MIPIYSSPEQPRYNTKLTPIIYRSSAINYLTYIKLGNIVLASFMLIWMVLLLIGNWATFISFFKNPTVNTVLYFGFAIIVMLASVSMVALSIIIQLMPEQIKTSCDDLRVVVCSLEGIMLVGTISILVWSFKVLSIGINLSILLTLFFPLAVGAITFYLLNVILVS